MVGYLRIPLVNCMLNCHTVAGSGLSTSHYHTYVHTCNLCFCSHNNVWHSNISSCFCNGSWIRHKRYILLIIVLNGSIGLLTCAMYVGILFWYDLMILQGLSAVEGASAVMVLLPSLVLAILGQTSYRKDFLTGK